MASCRVVFPVRKVLTPAMDIECEKVEGLLMAAMRSAIRPPQPVWLTASAMEVCQSETWSE
jgi:hypothetical protein